MRRLTNAAAWALMAAWVAGFLFSLVWIVKGATT